MHEYPIELVYHFYAVAVREETRDRVFIAGLGRMVGITARDVDAKGAKSVSAMWDSFIGPMQKVLKDKGEHKMRRATQASKNAPPHKQNAPSHSAANAFLSSGNNFVQVNRG